MVGGFGKAKSAVATKDLGVRGAAAATCGPVPIERTAGSGGVLQSKKELLSS